MLYWMGLAFGLMAASAGWLPNSCLEARAAEELGRSKTGQPESGNLATDRLAQLTPQQRRSRLEEELRQREREQAEAKRREEQQKEADKRKEEEEARRRDGEEARLAPKCDPLKARVASSLSTPGASDGAFNQVLGRLREVEKQLPGSCPDRVKIFGGPIETIFPCYNNALYMKLTDGMTIILTVTDFGPGATSVVGAGVPQRTGEWVMGITDQPYFCIKSTAPLEVWPGSHISIMARKRP